MKSYRLNQKRSAYTTSDMKKTVFAVWGRSKIGKSSSIKRFIDYLEEKYGVPPHEIIHRGKDACVIFKINKVLIGIESQGDPGGRMQRSLQYFKEKKCDIIVCATRTSGSTANAVKSIFNEEYDIVWMSTYFSDKKDIAKSNKFFAAHLDLLIENVLKKGY